MHWPSAPDRDRFAPFAPPAPLILAVRDSRRVRFALGLALGALGALLHLVIARVTDGPLSFAAIYPCVAIAALLGGLEGGLTALCVSALALWRLWQPATGAEVSTLALFVVGGAFITAASALLHAIWRRRVLEAIGRNEERLRLAIDAGAVGLFEADYVSNSAFFGENTRKIFGVANEAPLNTDTVGDLVIEEDRPERQAALDRAMDPLGDGIYQAKYRIRRANDGALRWVSASARATFENGKVTRIIGVNRDITDEMNAEAILHEKARLAEQLTGLAEALPGAVYSYKRRVDGSAFLPYASPNIENLLGLGQKTFIDDLSAMLERVPAEDHARINEAIDASQRQLTPWRMTFRYDHPQRGLICIEGDSTPVRQTDGAVIWYGYMQDFTERANAESALAASEARARAVIEGAAEAIFTFDETGVISSANAASARMFGRPVEELIGGGVDRLMTEPFRRAHNSQIRDCVAKRDECLCLNREIQGLRGDGAEFPMSLTISQTKFGQGRLFVGFAHDLTERRRIDERVRQLNDERLASLEAMAASLAHEVNQPLAAGATFLAVARKMLAAPPKEGAATIGQLLAKASEQMVRAGKIINAGARVFAARRAGQDVPEPA